MGYECPLVSGKTEVYGILARDDWAGAETGG